MQWFRISVLCVFLSKALFLKSYVDFEQGAATAVEDGAVLAECLSHAQFTSDIPKLLQTYEKIRRPRVERIQATALITGQYKVMPDGPAQVKRDEKMAQRMDKANPRYEYWKAGGGLEWLYGYDFMKEVSSATRTVGARKRGTMLTSSR